MQPSRSGCRLWRGAVAACTRLSCGGRSSPRCASALPASCRERGRAESRVRVPHRPLCPHPTHSLTLAVHAQRSKKGAASTRPQSSALLVDAPSSSSLLVPLPRIAISPILPRERERERARHPTAWPTRCVYLLTPTTPLSADQQPPASSLRRVRRPSRGTATPPCTRQSPLHPLSIAAALADSLVYRYCYDYLRVRILTSPL